MDTRVCASKSQELTHDVNKNKGFPDYSVKKVLEFSNMQWDSDDRKTPPGAPRLNGVAETFPGAPIRPSKKSSKICEKLEVEALFDMEKGQGIFIIAFALKSEPVTIGAVLSDAPVAINTLGEIPLETVNIEAALHIVPFHGAPEEGVSQPAVVKRPLIILRIVKLMVANVGVRRTTVRMQLDPRAKVILNAQDY
ncbi:hypothetical protein COLO4_11202 [Corchorus olitorius]|uniref:Uncharacterized protein n=1 Tax=Corchorus olitorius TaxID=93759 RepID=A0A1R3K5G0_9ROSI|nr:hypothetical protein COLO4_11202 [Corchorus olitorius]